MCLLEIGLPWFREWTVEKGTRRNQGEAKKSAVNIETVKELVEDQGLVHDRKVPQQKNIETRLMNVDGMTL